MKNNNNNLSNEKRQATIALKNIIKAARQYVEAENAIERKIKAKDSAGDNDGGK